MGELESRIAELKNYWHAGFKNSVKQTFAQGGLSQKSLEELKQPDQAAWTYTFWDSIIGSSRCVGNMLIGGGIASVREVITSIVYNNSFTLMDFLNNYVDYSDFTVETIPKTFFNFLGATGLLWNMVRLSYSITTRNALAGWGVEPFLQRSFYRIFKRGGYLSRFSKGKYDECRGEENVIKGMACYGKYLYEHYIKGKQ